MGLSYANLFVGYVEKHIFEQYTGPIPDFFGRFINDCLGTASCSRVDLECFINFVGNFHPVLKFLWEISETCLSSLDILVSINGDALTTSVAYKPTDSHSYLLFPSSHPKHTKKSSLILNSCVFAAFAEMIRTLRPSLWKWEPFLPNVVILPIRHRYPKCA